MSIPTNAGNVVSVIKYPPKCAAIANVARPNNCPPGAAISPTIEYTTPHVNTPIRMSATTRENCRYVGQYGYGQNLDQCGGDHDGCSTLDRHLIQNENHQDLKIIILINTIYLY